MKAKEKIPAIKTGIKQQLLVVFSFSVVLPVLFLGIFFIFNIRKQMTEHYTAQVKADCMRVNSILFDITTSIYTSSEPLCESQETMMMFGSEFDAPGYRTTFNSLESSITQFQKNTASVTSATIYTNNPYLPESAHITYLSDYSTQPWYLALPEDSMESWICMEYEDRFGNNTYELCLVRQMGVVSQTYSAYMVLCIDNNYLRNRLEQNEYEIMAALEGSTAFYSSDYQYIKTAMPMPEDFEGGYYKYTGPLERDGQKVVANIQTFSSYRTNNKFYISVYDDTAYANINHITRNYVGILLLLSIVPCLIIYLYSSYFSKRISTLRYAMHQARMGDYNIIDTFQGDDELAETFHDLKVTVNRIHDQTSEYYTTKINNQKLINKQQQMEYHMLASQINPHFLYNTLETIRVQALSQNCKDVVTSINLLGKTMHYVLENTGTNITTLEKELDYIKNYLAIQKIRFGDRVNAVFEIPEEYDLQAIHILPLLLQPIVENSIIHGLEDIYGNGYITISMEQEGDLFLIRISDNGTGMDAETLRKVQENLISHDAADAKSIGLYNINQRIKLFYGNDYGLKIDSRPNEGTTATLTLPYAHLLRTQTL